MKSSKIAIFGLSKVGLRFKAPKCKFQKESVEYLGHRIDANGVHPLDEKVKAVVGAPAPTNISELKSFLGMVQYYQRFLPNLATTLAPLHRLLQKNKQWSWSRSEQEAFWKVKSHLSSCKLLVHPQLPVTLACDASAYGVGAVLSHIMADGTEKLIAFVSRSMSGPEKNYSQLDKEALAIIFGTKKFHQYIYGCKFQLISDHKPLMGLLDSQKAIPLMASARLQRWALMLSAYDYTITYHPGSKLANADCLSRLPLTQSVANPPVPGDTVMLLESMEAFPVNVTEIKSWTGKDPLLSRVRKLVLSGFPDHLPSDEQMKPYVKIRNDQDGVLLWGGRVIVPSQVRFRTVDPLHEAHPGISRMKSIARGLVWWPGMDVALEEKVKTCSVCQQSRLAPAEARLHPWDWPEKPWGRTHLDYAGPYMLIDAHSKWMDAFSLNSSTTSATLECLRSTFAIHGLSETIVTDNGTCFTSEDFTMCMNKNGIHHICVAPYHPASNGLAERAVQTIKAGLAKMSGGTIETKVSRFLFRYRNKSQGTTGQSPAELLLGRRPRSHLDLMHPDLGRRVHHKQQKQAEYHDVHAKDRVICVGDKVYVIKFAQGVKWLPGLVVEKPGPVSFVVRLHDERVVRRHIDHVRIRWEDTLVQCKPPEANVKIPVLSIQ